MVPPHASNLTNAQRFTAFTLVQDWIWETNNTYVTINEQLIEDNVELIQENDELRIALNRAAVHLDRIEAQLEAANETVNTLNQFAVRQTLTVTSLQARLHELDDALFQRNVRRRLSFDSQETIVVDSDTDDDALP